MYLSGTFFSCFIVSHNSFELILHVRLTVDTLIKLFVAVSLVHFLNLNL